MAVRRASLPRLVALCEHLYAECVGRNADKVIDLRRNDVAGFTRPPCPVKDRVSLGVVVGVVIRIGRAALIGNERQVGPIELQKRPVNACRPSVVGGNEDTDLATIGRTRRRILAECAVLHHGFPTGGFEVAGKEKLEVPV